VLFLVRIRLGRKLRAKIDSWDVVQEVMLRSLRDLPTFRNEHATAFRRYLAKKVEQVIRDQADYWKARKRDPQREVALSPGDSAEASAWDVTDMRHSHTPSERLRLQEDLSQLAEAMDELAESSADDWEVLVAVKIVGTSLEELAAQRSVSVDAMKMKTRRAMLKLAHTFRRHQQGWGGNHAREA
jgi:RNA polymerase sigma factor (sigma-70 family)